MTYDEAIEKFNLPNPACRDDLERRFSRANGKIVRYNDSLRIAGLYDTGDDEPHYFGAIYEHLDDDFSDEGVWGLRRISDADFKDEGHAMIWALDWR